MTVFYRFRALLATREELRGGEIKFSCENETTGIFRSPGGVRGARGVEKCREAEIGLFGLIRFGSLSTVIYPGYANETA